MGVTTGRRRPAGAGRAQRLRRARARLGATVLLALALTHPLVVQAAHAGSGEVPPVITSILPATGSPGDLITVRGYGFGGRTASVTVGGVPARLITATGTALTFELPWNPNPDAQTVRVTKRSGHWSEIPFNVTFDGQAVVETAPLEAVSMTIGREGGTIEVGDVSLSIPPGALLEPVEITLIPILRLGGSPLESSMIAGVVMEPAGLQFTWPAELSLPLGSVKPADVLGFASESDGSDLHLVPHRIEDGRVVLQVWHFSTGGASGGGAGAASGMVTYTPTAAESAALQAIAAADAGCAAEQAQQIFDGPACAGLRNTHADALHVWWATAVRPGLEAAVGAPMQTFADAFLEWLRWGAAVEQSGVEDILAAEVAAARALAWAAFRDIAFRRLENCTGTDLVSQLRDVGRLTDFAQAGAFDEPIGPDLPQATNLLPACAQLVIDEVELPAVLARDSSRNTLRARVSLDVYSGPNRTDVPSLVGIDVSGGGPAQEPLVPDAEGRFSVAIETGSSLSTALVDITAEAQSPLLLILGLGDARATALRPARDRLEITATASSLVPGAAAGLLIQLAGDEVDGRQVSLSLVGPGSLASTTVVTAAGGSAGSSYTAGGSPGETATVTASFQDGSLTRTDTVTFTIASPPNPGASVTVSPAPESVEYGTTTTFSAAVTGAASTAVTWSATGGTISSSGVFTPTALGAASVTATSVADPSASDTVEFQVLADVQVSISPTAAIVATGATQQFTATVTGHPDTAVGWVVTGNGTVSSTGLFTAGDVGTATVTATSLADPTESATATITITVPPGRVRPRTGHGMVQADAIVWEGTGTGSCGNIQAFELAWSGSRSCSASRLDAAAASESSLTFTAVRDTDGYVTSVTISGSSRALSTAGSIGSTGFAASAGWVDMYVEGTVSYQLSGSVMAFRDVANPACSWGSRGAAYVALGGGMWHSGDYGDGTTIPVSSSGTLTNEAVVLYFEGNVDASAPYGIGPQTCDIRYQVNVTLTFS